MSNPIRPFLELDDERLTEGRVALLCNACSFDPWSGRYLFEILAERGCLVRVFLAEHGLFGELQDQVAVGVGQAPDVLPPGVETVSLYGADEASLTPEPAVVADLDALVVDLQDVGARYYTFATTLAQVIETLATLERAPALYVLERPNLAGRQVEGTALAPEFASFVGRAGVIHRHGLTLGELARLFADESGLASELRVVGAEPDERPFSGIPASPNLPGPYTQHVYSGQCLLEGTNLSEGRGTTRPFETFGAPFLSWIWRARDLPEARGARLRRLCFVPAFHKFAGSVCHGFQIHLDGGAYHSLGHSLRLIRWLRERSAGDFAWRDVRRDGPYEFRSDRRAIELLAGDATLLAYLEGKTDEATMLAALGAGERDWARRVEPYLPRGAALAFADPRGIA